MCGIAGIVSSKKVNRAAVSAMNNLQAYRGPDGDGVWASSDECVVLGHRRLAILDLSPLGAQPMVDDEAGLAITYNGEIYNYLEVREKLVQKGHAFRTQTDTEVLLRAYVEWGEDCLSQFNGMFAFAIWNAKARTVFCARDRFGEKPFVYATTKDAFVFASEAKSVALIDGVDLTVHAGVLSNYVDHDSTWLDAGADTLLQGVKQLLPSHAMLLSVDKDAVRIRKIWNYWSVNVAGRKSYGSYPLDVAANELLDLMRDSVRLRMRSDVRVGSCLSGGLDSSAIVGLMRMLVPNAEIRTFTGRFPGDPMDEGPYAKLVVERNQTHSAEVMPTAERFLRDAEKVYFHAEFPIGGMSQFAQYCVFGLAKEHDTTVLLDGQGSDEQLGGYGNSIVRAMLMDLAAGHQWRAFLHERKMSARRQPELFGWPKLALHETPLRAIAPALRRRTGRSVLTLSDLVDHAWLEGARTHKPAPAWSEGLQETHAFSSMLFMLSFRTMLSSLLRFGDRLSMAHSREVRLPFCDHRIAELLFQLPPELLVGEGQVKRVLRRAIVGIVPNEIVTREKQGFVPPQGGWLTGPLAKWVEQLAENIPSSLSDTLNRKTVLSLARAPVAERTRDVARLWDVANVLACGTYSLDPMRTRQRLSATA